MDSVVSGILVIFDAVKAPTASFEVESDANVGQLPISATPHVIDAECCLYDRLFSAAEPNATGDFKSNINPHSLEVLTAKCESNVCDARPEVRYQFERLGYFSIDPDSDLEPPVPSDRKLVFNRTITLKDTWAKIEKKPEKH